MTEKGFTQGDFEVELPKPYLGGTIAAEIHEVGETTPARIIGIIERSMSTMSFELLKRGDEYRVVKNAHENPKFVEDMVREATLRLTADENISWFSVEAENFESIHNHSAYAAVERDKR